MPNPADPKYKNQKNKFISDCVSIVSKENPDKTQAQVLGQCFGMWEAHKKKAAASLGVGLDDEVLFFEEENKEDKKDE